MFRQDFTCPALLKDLIQSHRIRGYHPLSCRTFQTVLLDQIRPLACSAFARHY